MRRLYFKGVKAAIGMALLMLLVIDVSYAGSKPGGNFSLIDQDQNEFQLKQLEGNIVLLFFGYTSCPDVCPTVLGTVAQVLRKFETQDSPVKALFISVDPARDTPLKLKQYTKYFSSQLVGLTGSPEQIKKVAQLYQARYKISRDANQNISVDHSSNLYVIDQQGEINAIVPFGMRADHIINIVKHLFES